MNADVEPMQQPIRKIVGRKATVSQQLVCLEEMIALIKKKLP